MEETQAELSQQETARWFYKLRTHPDLVELVSEADEFDVTVDELYDEEVRLTETGEVIVFLRLQDDEVTNYLAKGIFGSEESENPETLDIEIQKSDVYGPLAGHGVRWKIEDGQVVEREWLS